MDNGGWAHGWEFGRSGRGGWEGGGGQTPKLAHRAQANWEEGVVLSSYDYEETKFIPKIFVYPKPNEFGCC